MKFKASSKSFACILVALESLDDDCLISPDAMCAFLDRIRYAFGLQRTDPEIVVLKKELHELLCHNTDLEGDLDFALDHLRIGLM